MSYENMEEGEKLTTGGKPAPSIMTLAKAVELGEYDPAFLATFAEWNTLSRHIQFQYIRDAIENRNKHLLMQWAEIDRMLDFRLKPQLKEAQKNIEKQMKKLMADRERLYVEYSK